MARESSRDRELARSRGARHSASTPAPLDLGYAIDVLPRWLRDLRIRMRDGTNTSPGTEE